MRTHRCTLVFIAIALCLAGCTLGPDSIVMEGGRLYPWRPSFAVVPSSSEINQESGIDFDSIYLRSRIWSYEGVDHTNYLHVRFWPTGECAQIVTMHEQLSKEFYDSIISTNEWSMGFYATHDKTIVFEVYAGGAYNRYYGSITPKGIHVTRTELKYQNANFSYSNDVDLFYKRNQYDNLLGQPDWSPTGVLVRVQER